MKKLAANENVINPRKKLETFYNTEKGKVIKEVIKKANDSEAGRVMSQNYLEMHVIMKILLSARNGIRPLKRIFAT